MWNSKDLRKVGNLQVESRGDSGNNYCKKEYRDSSWVLEEL